MVMREFKPKVCVVFFLPSKPVKPNCANDFLTGAAATAHFTVAKVTSNYVAANVHKQQ